MVILKSTVKYPKATMTQPAILNATRTGSESAMSQKVPSSNSAVFMRKLAESLGANVKAISQTVHANETSPAKNIGMHRLPKA